LAQLGSGLRLRSVGRAVEVNEILRRLEVRFDGPSFSSLSAIRSRKSYYYAFQKGMKLLLQ